MYIQINKEGRTRYKRKYFFPDSEDTWIETDVSFSNERGSRWGKFNVARFTFKTLSITFRCPHCGLQMYGQWYRGEEFIAKRAEGSDGRCRFEEEYYLGEYHLTFRELWLLEEQEKKAYTEVSKRIEAEIYAVRSMKTCPICGETLSNKIEQETENFDPRSDFDWNFKQLAYQDDDYPGIDSGNTLQSIKDTIIPQDIDTDTKKIVSNPDLLQKYIKHLLNTEMTIQLLEKRHSSLCCSAYFHRQNYIQAQAEQMSEIAGAKYSSVKAKKPTINDVVLNVAMPIEPSFSEHLPAEPVYGKPGLFNKKKVLAQNELLRSKYEVDCQTYRRKKEEYDKQLRKYHSALDSYNRKKEEAFTRLLNEHKRKEAEIRATFSAEINQIKEKIAENLVSYAIYQETLKEIQSTEKMFSQSYACLRSLYSCGIIYEKYRNPVALSSFYDYLAAGRCESLTGADGAYNIFESEVRLDLIITKLDVVISQLDQIRANQYTLYCEMSKMNKSLDELNRTADSMSDRLRNIEEHQKKISNNTKKISDITEVIAHNTAVTAFYAKKNAELTDALGFMVALK